MRAQLRWTPFAVLIGLIAAACGSTLPPPGSDTQGAGGDSSVAPTHGAGSCDAPPEPYGPSEDVEEAPVDENAELPWLREDAAVLDGFDADEIISGGPPPDGIAPIEEPRFTCFADGDGWLEAQSPVMVVEIDGDARAYPLAIMTQHEIANDVIAGVPVVVTYCPLCNSGLAFERTVDGQVLDFGTSGRLYRSNLVMYDRQTKGLWSQFTGTAVVGEPFVGTELERLPTSILSWEEFKQVHPGGLVLSRDTGFDREYGRNPYPGYEGSGSSFLYRGPTDERLDPNARVVGLSTPEGRDAVAIPLDRLRDERVVEVEVGDGPVAVFWAPGAASALDADTVSEGRDVGQTASFRPFGPDGTHLTFQASSDHETRFLDDQTGSVWNLAGEAISGELQGHRLEEVPRDDTWWFVWFAFRPETTIASG